MNLPYNVFDTADDERWQAVVTQQGTVISKAQARAMALVLDSRSIPCCIVPAGYGWSLLIPEAHLESALRELQLYEQENSNWPPPLPPHRPLTGTILPTLSILILLAAFHNVTLIGVSLPGHGLIDLKEIGTAHAAAIRDGALWSCITALTLHADLPHLLSNLTIGGTFILLLCRELGSGVSWSLLLASGGIGNLVNAWVQAPDHRSVGASTAVFGAVGILAAISTYRYRHHLQRRWFVPVAAGLALLAILGTEGKQTDLGAHLFGFIAGALLGIGVEWRPGRRWQPGGALDTLLALASGAVVAGAWWMAITAGRS